MFRIISDIFRGPEDDSKNRNKFTSNIQLQVTTENFAIEMKTSSVNRYNKEHPICLLVWEDNIPKRVSLPHA